MHCDSCNRCGDSLEFFGYMRALKDPREAIDRAIQEGFFKEAPEVAADRNCIEAYVTNFPERWRKLRKIWSIFQSGLLDTPQPELLERIQRDGLWSGRGPRSARLFKFLGATTRSNIIKVMGEDYGKIFPKGHFGTSIVLNYQDVPGRTCALRFIDERGRDKFCPLIRATVTNKTGKEGGLAMLEALRPFDRLVFATDNVDAALQLHRRHFMDFDMPLKLVLYNEDTETAWHSVHASRVVFWSPDSDWKVFAQAKKLGSSGFVTNHPAIRKASPREYFSGAPVNAVIKGMEEHAKPWTEALAVWVTDDRRREAEVDMALNLLALTTKERKDIRDNCPAERRHILDHYLGEMPIVRQTLIGGKKILERDGWFVIHQKGEECICDAVVTVEREVVDAQAQKIYWEGTIEYRGVKISFFHDLEEIERGFPKWLRGLMVNAGLGVPMINKQWQAKLINIARMMSDPRTVRLNSMVGVDKTGRISFPSFYVEKGKAHKQETFLPGMPGACVGLPKLRQPTSSDLDVESRALFACGASAVVHNLMAPVKDTLECPWAFIGSPGSMADSLCRHIAVQAGMNQFDVEDYTRLNINRIRDKLGACSYPAVVRSTAVGQLRFWSPAHRDNVLFVVDPRDAAALFTGGHWGEVYAPESRLVEWPPFDDIINYLVALQEKDYELPEGELGDAILEDFCSWYAVYLKLDVLELLERAKVAFRFNIAPHEGILDLYCWGLSDGHVPIDHINFKQHTELLLNATRRQGIIVDDVDGLVLLESTPLLRMSRNYKLPVLNTGNAIEDFIRRSLFVSTDTSDGWIISKESWDAHVSRWVARKRG